MVVISLITVRAPMLGLFLAKPSGSYPLLALLFLQREPLVLLASFSLLYQRALHFASALCQRALHRFASALFAALNLVRFPASDHPSGVLMGLINRINLSTLTQSLPTALNAIHSLSRSQQPVTLKVSLLLVSYFPASHESFLASYVLICYAMLLLFSVLRQRVRAGAHLYQLGIL